MIANAAGTSSGVAGEKIRVTPRGEIVRSTVAAHDPTWQWAAHTAPLFDINDQTFAAFADWVARETGRKVVYESSAAQSAAGELKLRGSIAGLDPDTALNAVLSTTQLRRYQTKDELIGIALHERLIPTRAHSVQPCSTSSGGCMTGLLRSAHELVCCWRRCARTQARSRAMPSWSSAAPASATSRSKSTTSSSTRRDSPLPTGSRTICTSRRTTRPSSSSCCSTPAMFTTGACWTKRRGCCGPSAISTKQASSRSATTKPTTPSTCWCACTTCGR